MACAGGSSGSGSTTPAPAVPSASAGSPSAGISHARLSVTMGQQFELEVGQSAAVAGVSSVVTFRAVANDSRCAAGNECVQAGNAAVVLNVATGGAAARAVTLNTTTPPRETALGNGILRLVSLAPAPVAGGTIEPSTYVATICVCRQ